MSDELTTLVEALGDIERRIAELTGGQSDTVMLGSFGPLLLPEAQKHILRSEAEQRQFADERAAILDALPAHIALLGPDGRISFANKAWKDFALANGLAGANHAVGRSYVDECDRAWAEGSEKAGQVGRGIRSILSGMADSYAAEYACDAPDGQRWFELLAAPMPRSSGYGAVVMHLDISTRMLAEAALRESEAAFRDLAEAMPQIVWTMRADGWTIYSNRQWADYTGLALEESLGHGWRKPLHPADGERALAAWQKATGSGGPFALECRLRAADGAYKWWLIRGVPLKDVAGNVLNWYCTCTDIHEFKEAQVQLKDQAALLDKARDAIVVLDLESRILYWNAGAERIYGWTSEGSLGRSFVGFTVHDTAAYQKAMDATLADGEWFGELEQRTKDGRGIVVEAGVVCCAASRERPSPSWSSTPMSHSVAPSRHSCARPSVWRR